jgi:hypothetical protein
MKYHVVSAGNTGELEKAVNELLEQGWTLQGGVCATAHAFLNQRDDYWESVFEYSQALTQGK